MAKVNKNLLLAGLSGKLGNLVVRTRNGKTHVYVMTDKAAPKTPKQKAYQQRFAEAVAFAKGVLADEGQKALYTQKAKQAGKESAYAMAVSEKMKESKE